MAKKKGKHFHILKILLFIIVLLISLVAYSYFIEPKIFTYKEYPIKDEKIKNQFKGFKIVHITDIHYGRNFNKESLKKIVKSINEQKPDIVVLTGDLIDKTANMTIEMSNEIAKELKKINAWAGKYAITGDQDLKYDEFSNIINNSNFTKLDNTYDTIYKEGYKSMLIAGISTAKDKEDINSKLLNTKEYINSFEKDGPIYKILIMHEPDYIDDITDNNFDLILAGHSLNGQINLPFKNFLLEKGAQKYYKNHYKINNSDLYISNGLGTTNYDFRFLNIPSYNIYKII